MSTKLQVYLNGRFLMRDEARVDVEDRGMLFADGIYEVIRYYNGKPLAMDRHMERLRHSLDAVKMPHPADRLDEVSSELMARNQLQEAKVYWQISRGYTGPRDYAFPKETHHTVLVITYPVKAVNLSQPPLTLRAILTEDLRWHRCDIKSLMLMPNMLAHNAALAAGVDAAILHRGQTITESTATSAFIVRENQLWSHPADQWILGGITRSLLIDLARGLGVPVVERTFTKQELLSADEVILCGTTTHVAAVTEVDGRSIGSGRVGPITQRLHEAFLGHVAKECGV